MRLGCKKYEPTRRGGGQNRIDPYLQYFSSMLKEAKRYRILLIRTREKKPCHTLAKNNTLVKYKPISRKQREEKTKQHTGGT